MQITIDGSQGKGGGQILRTALTLSMCTGCPLLISNIRAKRKSPGLMRQHLTAVKAAEAICGADVEGAYTGSTQVHFVPGPVKGGEYRFNIGTAGSCTLVLQTILLPLLMASHDSRIVLYGGTHNAMSPPFHFLQRAFLPLLQQMGGNVRFELNRYGFYPAGGGEIVTIIEGRTKLSPLLLPSRGQPIGFYAESVFAGLPTHIATRELATVKQKLSWQDDQLKMTEIDRRQGPGNALLIMLEHEYVTEVFTGFAKRGVCAEAVASVAIRSAQHYLASGAAVSAFLTDQLLLPMAVAGSGFFTATEWSPHAATNAKIIEQVLPVKIVHETCTDGTIKINIV